MDFTDFLVVYSLNLQTSDLIWIMYKVMDALGLRYKRVETLTGFDSYFLEI